MTLNGQGHSTSRILGSAESRGGTTDRFQAHGTVDPHVSRVYTGIDVPRFNGSSYIVFPPLVTSRALVVSVELRPESADGLLLYNGNDRSRFKDFIAIALTRRHVELRSRCIVLIRNVLMFFNTLIF